MDIGAGIVLPIPVNPVSGLLQNIAPQRWLIVENTIRGEQVNPLTSALILADNHSDALIRLEFSPDQFVLLLTIENTIIDASICQNLANPFDAPFVLGKDDQFLIITF